MVFFVRKPRRMQNPTVTPTIIKNRKYPSANRRPPVTRDQDEWSGYFQYLFIELAGAESCRWREQTRCCSDVTAAVDRDSHRIEEEHYLTL